MREEKTTIIIPAASGWYLGELIGDRQEIAEAKHLDICPVIAWEMSARRAHGTCIQAVNLEARR
jgi:hypothetical protein